MIHLFHWMIDIDKVFSIPLPLNWQKFCKRENYQDPVKAFIVSPKTFELYRMKKSFSVNFYLVRIDLIAK